MKQILIVLAVLVSTFIHAQDTTIVSYRQTIGDDGRKLLLPIETPVIYDTVKLYNNGFEYDTLKKVYFTWINAIQHVVYSKGYLIEELTVWKTSTDKVYRETSQYFISIGKRRFYFKNYLVDEDGYSQYFLNSIPRHRKWWEKEDFYILELYD